MFTRFEFMLLSKITAVLRAYFTVSWILIILLPVTIHAEEMYNYPIADPFAATVIGTPRALQAPFSQIPSKQYSINVFKDRIVPNILQYAENLRYSAVFQDSPAPLAFIIAGTGGSDQEATISTYMKFLYNAGFHVICLPSPTHPNFIVAASSSAIPGHPREDARDIYRVMELVWEKHRDKISVTGFSLAGYSLGAIQAAFVAELDQDRKRFNFNRTVLVNPPVNLYKSVTILDDLINQIPGGMASAGSFFDEQFTRLASIYHERDSIDFSGDFLYAAYKDEKTTNGTLPGLVGIVFRSNVATMVFTVDVMTNNGYIKPKNLELGITDPLSEYLKVSNMISFNDYFKDIFAPYYISKTPGLTEQQLIDQLSIKKIEVFLRASPSVYLFHNQDDILLAPGDIEYLSQLFGSRSKIYPRGGHLGNHAFKANSDDFVAAMHATEQSTANAPGSHSSEDGVLVSPSTFEKPSTQKSVVSPTDGMVGCVNKPADDSTIVPARKQLKELFKTGRASIVDVYDPWERMNRMLYHFNAGLDKYVVLPLVSTYEYILPMFVQDRVSGVFSNIGEVKNFYNAALQLSLSKTIRTLGRFLVNSTLGLAGMWDPAKSMGLHQQQEDFGQTLGYYGIPFGPYLVLPLYGPSGFRDTVGFIGDTVAKNYYLTAPTDMDRNLDWYLGFYGTSAVDSRHSVAFRYFQTGSPFEYEIVRLLYTRMRKVLVED